MKINNSKTENHFNLCLLKLTGERAAQNFSEKGMSQMWSEGETKHIINSISWLLYKKNLSKTNKPIKFANKSFKTNKSYEFAYTNFTGLIPYCIARELLPYNWDYTNLLLFFSVVLSCKYLCFKNVIHSTRASTRVCIWKLICLFVIPFLFHLSTYTFGQR